MDSNPSKREKHHEEPSPASERKAAQWHPIWAVHRSATRLEGSSLRERCERRKREDHNFCTSIQLKILQAKKM
jgi:hypothetical protein